MENYSESERWMKDARDCFLRTKRCFNENDWRGAIQNGQLAIELSAKAMISSFEEPDWTHSPDKQLKEIIEVKKEEIANRFSPSFVETLIQITEDVKIAAPWHGWSVYGREREDGGGWIPAVELSTRLVIISSSLIFLEPLINTVHGFGMDRRNSTVCSLDKKV